MKAQLSHCGRMNTIAFLSLLLLPTLWACSPPEGWEAKPDAKRLPDAKIVVYGKFLKEIKESPLTIKPDGRPIDFQFQVYCVLKSSGRPVAENVTIAHVLNSPGECHKEDRTLVQEGNEVIVMMKRNVNLYELDKVNVQAAVLNVTDERLKFAGTPATVPSGCCNLAWSQRATQVCKSGSTTAANSISLSALVMLLIFALGYIRR